MLVGFFVTFWILSVVTPCFFEILKISEILALQIEVKGATWQGDPPDL